MGFTRQCRITSYPRKLWQWLVVSILKIQQIKSILLMLACASAVLDIVRYMVQSVLHTVNRIQDYAKQRIMRHQVMCRPATKGTVITSWGLAHHYVDEQGLWPKIQKLKWFSRILLYIHITASLRVSKMLSKFFMYKYILEVTIGWHLIKTSCILCIYF